MAAIPCAVSPESQSRHLKADFPFGRLCRAGCDGPARHLLNNDNPERYKTMNTITTPTRDESGQLIGSAFPVGWQVSAAGVLSSEQIRSKYGLTQREFDRIANLVRRKRVVDLLFHAPDGPIYDVLLYLVSTSR